MKLTLSDKAEIRSSESGATFALYIEGALYAPLTTLEEHLAKRLETTTAERDALKAQLDQLEGE